jgi:hypothetical protein
MDHRYAVSATLLFTPGKQGAKLDEVVDGIASALNEAGEQLGDSAAIIVAGSPRDACSLSLEIALLEDRADPWVLLAGDPRGGFQVFGPFADEQSCEEYPAGWDDSDWWPLELTPPANWRTATT